MKIPPQHFFAFCAAHVPLLRELACHEGEVTEADARRVIAATSRADAELPETTWKRLHELQILVSTEPGSEFYVLAEPVARLLAYLFDEARAATPEIIRGYIESLDTLNKRLLRAIDGDDALGVRLALEELRSTLQRLQADVDETHRSVVAEVAHYKAERRSVSVREKFSRIVHWMERYVDPLVEIVRPDGPLRATFDETERLLLRAADQTSFNDQLFLELNVRQLRLISRHALRLFQQCRRELEPLCESLRRSSMAAEGAAIALERLQRDGLDGWAAAHSIALCNLRLERVPSDTIIERVLRNVFEHPPEPAPILKLKVEAKVPAELVRHQWLRSLVQELRAEVPLTDLLAWLTARNPTKTTSDVLAGFTQILFHAAFSTQFIDGPPRSYETLDGHLRASPVKVVSHE